MTYQGGEFPISRLFEELKKSVENEKVQTQGEYNSLVDVLMDEKLGYGFFSAEEDLEQMKKHLKARWPEIEASIEPVNRYFG